MKMNGSGWEIQIEDAFEKGEKPAGLGGSRTRGCVGGGKRKGSGLRKWAKGKGRRENSAKASARAWTSQRMLNGKKGVPKTWFTTSDQRT